MSLFTELIIRGILVIAINDGVILYMMKRRSTPITIPIILEIIGVTCIVLVINIWFCLHQNGLM